LREITIPIVFPTGAFSLSGRVPDVVAFRTNSDTGKTSNMREKISVGAVSHLGFNITYSTW
jgi:hypothetical protein